MVSGLEWVRAGGWCMACKQPYHWSLTRMTLKPTDVELAYEAAQRVVRTHERLVEFLRAGQTLAEIDAFVGRTLTDLGCRSCFLGYRVRGCPAFPSHACLSVNDCIVHGTAWSYGKPMAAGDVLKIDVGVWHKGWVGDAAWTYVFGQPSPEVRRLMDVSKRSLALGVEELRPGNTYVEWARVVQRCVETEAGFYLVRGLGGHGYGRQLHASPFISNVIPTSQREWPDADSPCRPGTLVAVEPMVAVGTSSIRQVRGEWPIHTADGSLSVHHEHDVLITEDGPRVLTEGMERLPDVIE